MKKMVVVWIFLITGLVGVLIYTGFSYQKSVKAYSILENDMVESAMGYLKLNDIELVNGEKLKITSDELLSSNAIKSMKVKDDECVGYVNVKKKVKYDYQAFIKCKKYESLDYKE